MPEKTANRVVIDMTCQSMQVTEDSQWSPKGVLSMIDAFEAVEWAWILTQMAHEVPIAAYISWWKQLVRAKSNRIDQIKQRWMDCSWRLALELRQNGDFAQATRDIMADSSALQTALSRDPPAAPKNMPRPAKPAPPATRPWQPPRNSSQQGEGRYQDQRRQPYGQKSASTHRQTQGGYNTTG